MEYDYHKFVYNSCSGGMEYLVIPLDFYKALSYSSFNVFDYSGIRLGLQNVGEADVPRYSDAFPAVDRHGPRP